MNACRFHIAISISWRTSWWWWTKLLSIRVKKSSTVTISSAKAKFWNHRRSSPTCLSTLKIKTSSWVRMQHQCWNRDTMLIHTWRRPHSSLNWAKSKSYRRAISIVHPLNKLTAYSWRGITLTFNRQWAIWKTSTQIQTFRLRCTRSRRVISPCQSTIKGSHLISQWRPSRCLPTRTGSWLTRLWAMQLATSSPRKRTITTITWQVTIETNRSWCNNWVLTQPRPLEWNRTQQWSCKD